MLGKTFPNPSFGQPLVPGCFSFRCLGSSLHHERLPERFLRKGRRRLGKRRCWIPKLGRARNPRRSDRYTSQSRRVSQSPQKMPRNIDGRRHGIPHVCHILWDPIKMGKQWPWLVAGMGKRPNPYLLRFLPAAVRFRLQGPDPKLFLKGQPSKRRGKAPRRNIPRNSIGRRLGSRSSPSRTKPFRRSFPGPFWTPIVSFLRRGIHTRSRRGNWLRRRRRRRRRIAPGLSIQSIRPKTIFGAESWALQHRRGPAFHSRPRGLALWRGLG